jgi:uncharacterized cupin superfamily protein
MGLTHFDEARSHSWELGHLRSTWSFLGEAAGCEGIGVRRIQVPVGGWSTPAHEHGREEEIFYVLRGSGLSWQAGKTSEVRAGDCIVYRARRGAHSIHAANEPIDVLAFGPREYDEAVRFPRLGMSMVGGRFVDSIPGAVDRVPLQFIRESELGPPELPEDTDPPAPRGDNVANVDEVEGRPIERERVVRVRRDLGRAAGSVATGLKHYVVAPGKDAAPLHCHSEEEEIFVILDGSGTLELRDRERSEETPVRAGHVIARPPGTGVSHMFRASDGELTFLAYGTRRPGDMCYYPNSNKINFGGIGVIARLERLDYWDGED